MTDTSKPDYTRKDLALGLLGNAVQYGGIILGVHGVVDANADRGIACMFLGGVLYVLASPLKMVHDVKAERMLLSQLEERLRDEEKESKQ